MDAEVELPIAGTAVILRDSARGPEVLMLRRPDRGSFASGWVFPGGKVEPGDRAEAGGTLHGERESARRAAVRETQEEVGLDLSECVALSRWHPPVHVPVRIRTWFFVAPDPGGELMPAADEVVEAHWMTPEEALARHAAGDIVLFPPTWVTLESLVGRGSVADVLAQARLREEHATLFTTQLLDAPEGQTFLWEGDEEHASDGLPGGRHRLETGMLPWRFTRTES
ncbi:NUDIX hydrolase [Microbacterium keratanolyticum]